MFELKIRNPSSECEFLPAVMSLLLISRGTCCNVHAYRTDNGAINNLETVMIFVVYVTEGVIGYVSHELSVLLQYLEKNKYHKVEVWKRNKHVGGFYHK